MCAGSGGPPVVGAVPRIAGEPKLGRIYGSRNEKYGADDCFDARRARYPEPDDSPATPNTGRR